MKREKVRQIAQALGYNPFRDESSHAGYNAQRNLAGRTHYVDPDTLRFHKSRVLRCIIVDSGAFLLITESVALDPQGRERGFRPVAFDLTGCIIDRSSLDSTFKTSSAAVNAMWDMVDSLDPRAYYRDRLREEIDATAKRLSEARKIARGLK